MSATPARYARVAVDVEPAHLDHPFDYRVPPDLPLAVGQQVKVLFAGRRRRGWVLEIADRPETDPARTRDLSGVDGAHRWFDPADIAFFRWVADRYAATLASVLRHVVPRRVAAVDAEARAWKPPAPGPEPTAGMQGVWDGYDSAPLLAAVEERARDGHGTAERRPPGPAFVWRPLPGDDRAAMAGDLVARCLTAGRSALVLVPHPASALAAAVLAAAGPVGADLRAGPDVRAADRYRALLRCRLGHARVAVGERGAVFAPLRNLGLVVVEDEASPSYKEQRSPRFHARDVALARARFAGAPAVLVTDLPSAAAWRLLTGGHLRLVSADRRQERARSPRVEVVDLEQPRPGAQRTRLSPAAARRISAAVHAGGLAVVLTARRGEGAGLVCASCGRPRRCATCDAVLSAAPDAADGWVCRVCSWTGPPEPCGACHGAEVVALGAGAGRLAVELRRSYPEAEVCRMEGFDAPGPRRRPAVAVLTRGSVLTRPPWLGDGADAIVVPDADTLLNRPTLEAAEDALRLWLAVAHWVAPRGALVVQTREPTDPAVQALVRWDPEGFWRREAERREELRLPPAAAIVRVDAPPPVAADIAAQLRALPAADIEVLGPDLDGALFVKTGRLRGTLDALVPLRRRWAKDDLGVRITVDPAL